MAYLLKYKPKSILNLNVVIENMYAMKYKGFPRSQKVYNLNICLDVDFRKCC